MKIRAERVLMPEGFVRNKTVTIENGIIQGVGPQEAQCDIACATAVPGLIDEHVHGGFGVNVMHTTPDKMLDWLRFLMKNGVTQVLAGVYTHSVESMRSALETARQVMQMQIKQPDGALLSGVHMEGPFISKKALGAMDENTVLAPSVEAWKNVTAGYEDMIRLVTLAPEVPGAEALTGYLCARGIPVIAGHTQASAEEGQKAFAFGIDGICHFFNASTPIHHRKPGILTEALLDERIWCECICDMVHVHPSAVRLIYKAKGPSRMIVVSDAVSTTGLPDGVYRTGPETVVVHNGESRTPEGALSGGGALPLEEVRRLVRTGIPERDAFTMASLTPAQHLHIDGGCISPGRRAEILCLDSSLQPVCTVLGTQAVPGNA